MKFDKYYISQEIKNNLTDMGFLRPTDIQFKAIPPIMNGEDVLAIAQTGTGKTAAFAIPIIDKIHRNKSSKRTSGIKCLVMVPTRELAMPIGVVFAALALHTKTKSFALFGGVEQNYQIQRLDNGIDILIATPGRMFDLISQKFLLLNTIDTLILDEADHMLDLGFINDIRSIKKKLGQKHQTLFFSATINSEIKKLAYSQVKTSAIRIEVSPEDPVAKNVSHAVMFVEMDDKRFFLERFIKEHPKSRIMVFVRTRVRAERVEKAMLRVGIESFNLHGGKEQKDRTLIMNRYKAGEFNILIATDVSARGIDVSNVDYVINYDLPEKPDNYVHRVGRTGRGTSKGVAISFCSTEEKPRLGEIESFITKKVEVIPITEEEYAFTLDNPDEDQSIRELIDENEAWLKRKKIKGKKSVAHQEVVNEEMSEPKGEKSTIPKKSSKKIFKKSKKSKRSKKIDKK